MCAQGPAVRGVPREAALPSAEQGKYDAKVWPQGVAMHGDKVGWWMSLSSFLSPRAGGEGAGLRLSEAVWKTCPSA